MKEQELNFEGIEQVPISAFTAWKDINKKDINTNIVFFIFALIYKLTFQFSYRRFLSNTISFVWLFGVNYMRFSKKRRYYWVFYCVIYDTGNT